MTDTLPTSGTDASFGRVPPHDLLAEQSVLGGMMLSPEVAADVMALVQEKDFYRPAHQLIYTAIADLLARSEPVDAIAVGAELTRRGEITRVGGGPYLHTLTETVPTAANAGYYARIVADRAMLRRLVEAGTRAAQLGYSGEGEAVELVDMAQAEMMAITQRSTGSTQLRTLGAAMPRAVDRMQEMAAGKSGLIGISTGFADLDELTQGLRPGQLVVIGARPSIGKSTLAMDLARTAAIRDGEPCLFVSLEMGEEELMHRVLAAEARVPLHRIQAGRLAEAEWEAVSQVMPRVSAAPMVIEDQPMMTMAEIRSMCRRVAREMGLRLVVVDYLQLIRPPATARASTTRQEIVAEMSRDLKLLAKELGVTVVALSQLNRGPEQRTEKKPMLSDLRESGAVEQDADMVVLLHREDFYEKENSPRAGEADLIVAKHRNGPTATVTVAFQGHYSRFADMARG
ncbi:replicative DNA helicase [Marinactinospora thermotolerans]|uniref:replicative DNA helicase n=1 Tax=Marinactinospora thermotolerans TaxID=531310 RepID=UPI003D8B0CCC